MENTKLVENLIQEGVYQSDTAHIGMVETTGNKNGCIHRRLSSVGTHQGGSSPPSPINGEALGFTINTEKFVLTSQQSHLPAFHLPQHKLQAIKARGLQLLHKDASHQTIMVREIAQFIETTNTVAVATPPTPLFYRQPSITFKIRKGD